jgi:hypothetical protein
MASTSVARKSLVASGLLSFFFGPLGWLYAAPWSVALAGAGAWLLTAYVLPQFLLVYVVGIVAPISAIAGVFYAIGFNLTGVRTPLFGSDEKIAKLTAQKQ